MSILTPNSSNKSRGIENPAVLDLISQDAAANSVTLVMIEERPWDGSQARLFQIQEKINSYLSFALDGEMEETYPDLQGKNLVVQLDCTSYPDEKVVLLLDRVRQQLEKQNISLLVRVIERVPKSTKGECAAGSCSCAGTNNASEWPAMSKDQEGEA